MVCNSVFGYELAICYLKVFLWKLWEFLTDRGMYIEPMNQIHHHHHHHLPIEVHY